MTLRVRWLGRVTYEDGLALQRGLHADRGGDDYLLLLEHPAVYTMGVRARPEHVLVDDPATVGASVHRADRGGEVTYHGPGQLVGYVIKDVAGGPRSVPAHVHAVEQLIIDSLSDLGLPRCGRVDGLPGVWVDPDTTDRRKIAAVGVRITRGRSMHGFALNVTTDLAMFDHIVPCGITEYGVTSLAAEGIDTTMEAVVDAVAGRWGRSERQDVAWGRPDTPTSGEVVSLLERKPEWLRPRVHHGPDVLALRRSLREQKLVTVCEEAGCPNLSECWSDGTATFMVLGERCTRACGFCLIDTRRPSAPDEQEPARVADAVDAMGLAYAVVTMVARDDLADGGASHVVRTIEAIRERKPGTEVEVLISDLHGDGDALDAVCAARPDVFNHNVETVPRLQRLARPSASYARSLAVLARAKAAGLVTKTSIILGMGEEEAEVIGTLADLRALKVDIVTLGQYLRPSANHLPVVRWWRPEEFTKLKGVGEAMGIPHLEASPLTRSSYHARQAADTAKSTPVRLIR